MKNQVGTGKGLLYMALLLLLVLGVRHAELLQSPNAYFIGDSLDGFRSMMANFYHIQHDESYHHFLGANYPYGDKPGYADVFVPLINAVKYYSNNDTTWFPAIWNLSLIFSQLLCGLMLFLVFRELELPVWFSIAAALGLCTLSPQLDRFTSHYCLSFSFLLPMTIWLLIRFGRRPKLSISIAIAFIPILANHIHPYHMAMVVFLISGYFFFRFCYQPTFKQFKWLSSHLLIQLLIPLAYLFIITVLNDPIADRPAWPSGFTLYVTRLQSLILPIDLPLGAFIQENITDIQYVRSETRAYLGMVVIFGGLFLIFRYFYKKIRPSADRTADTVFNPTLRYLLWAAFVILMYAACIPFAPLGLEWMTDYLGYLRQFRALGRFAWVFFYVSNIAVLYALFHLIAKVQRETLRKFCYGLILGVLLLEGIGYLFWEKYELVPRPEQRELYSRADNPWLYSIKLEKYQAILPIPFFHIGSENIWMNPYGKQLHRTMWAGVETGLPVMGAFLGRTSLSQTINLVEMISQPYRRPLILDDLPNQKPFLVFVTKEAEELVNSRYNHILKDLTQLYEDESIRLFEMPISTFEKQVQSSHTNFRNEVDSAIMFVHPEILSKDSLVTFYYQSFDEEKSDWVYQGGGAKTLESRKPYIFFDGPLPVHQAKESYTISFWSKMDYDLAPKSKITYTEYLPASGEVLAERTYLFFEFIQVVDQGWMLVDVPLELKHKDSHLKITIQNEDLLYGEVFYLDELQIRSASTRLYKKEKDWIMVNNRWIPRKNQK